MERGQIFILFIALLFSACIKDKAQPIQPSPPCDSVVVTWEQDIQQLLVTKCSGTNCHISTLFPGAGLVFDEYGKTRAEVLDSVSCFMSSIRQDATCALMPLGLTKLMQSDIDMIQCWIINGAPKD